MGGGVARCGVGPGLGCGHTLCPDSRARAAADRARLPLRKSPPGYQPQGIESGGVTSAPPRSCAPSPAGPTRLPRALLAVLCPQPPLPLGATAFHGGATQPLGVGCPHTAWCLLLQGGPHTSYPVPGLLRVQMRDLRRGSCKNSSLSPQQMQIFGFSPGTASQHVPGTHRP